jgi:hypothetical protein
MKIKLHLFFVTTALTVCTIGLSYGQDATVSEYDILDTERERIERDKILFSPGEGEIRYIPRTTDPKTTDPKNSTSNTQAKDSLSHKIVVPVIPSTSKAKSETGLKAPAKQQPPKEDDDAILSFNFLYYIIQKYKLQDIVE